MLEVQPKFSYHKNKTSNTINANTAYKWNNLHMYRTSSNDMGKLSPQPVKRKDGVVPGYKGFLPGIKAQNLFGKSFKEISQQSLSPERLDQNEPFQDIGGPDWKQLVRQDKTLHSTTHLYGKTTIPLAFPKLRVKNVSSSIQDSYLTPKSHSKPTWRTKVNQGKFDSSPSSPRSSAYSSGFTTNSTLFDGKGWKTKRVLHSDMLRTQYRNRFNQSKPFHKSQLRASPMLYKKKEFVYDSKDNSYSPYIKEQKQEDNDENNDLNREMDAIREKMNSTMY